MIRQVACAIALSPLCLASPVAADPVAMAASLIGRPYVWGAEGPNSFDCSGLVQYVFGRHGIELPRRAISQSRVGDTVGRGLQRGDLVFFATDARRTLVTHVGIYEGNGMMIDASQRYGRVRRDNLDEDYWTDRFMFARRVADQGDVTDVREPSAEPGPRGDRRRSAARVLGEIAGAILRRPRR